MATETDASPRPIKEYINFNLAITRQPDGKYSAHVRSSPNGESSNPFEYTIEPMTLEALRVRVSQDKDKVSVSGPSDQQRKDFGDALYNLVFSGQVNTRFEASIAIADIQHKNVRLLLNLTGTPELVQLPWELLHDPQRDRFFSLSTETPLVRYIELAEGAKPLRVLLPLRILVLISPPTDADLTDAQNEWENLSSALEPLTQNGLIELYPIERASISALQSILRKREFHIVHFIGKSTFDEQTGQGMIGLHDDKKQPRNVRSDILGVLLHDHDSLRLVVLNSGSGARAAADTVFGGVARTLIQQGIPAVIAMQSDISAGAAQLFTESFYGSLADNYPIDAALIEGRKAIMLGETEAEWATPVLYMRATDGVLFDVAPAPTPPPTLSAGPPTASPAPATEPLNYKQLTSQAITAQKSAERISVDVPQDVVRWRKKFEEAYGLLERADKLVPDNPDILLRMAQVQARLDPEYHTLAKDILYRLEELIDEPSDDNQVRVLAEAFYLHANLTQPPSEKILQRARPLFQQLNDAAKMKQIDDQLKSVATPVVIQKAAAVTPPPAATEEFNPSGHWNIQVQDMVGSRLFVDFKANGTFLMQQQVGMYQVPVTGNWNFNPLTRQLALQGVVNTFQPFILALTLGSVIPNGFVATGSDGIGYVLTRANA